MKIYRYVLGCLLVFFIAVGVWYLYSCYYEQRSTSDGTLVFRQAIKGEEGIVPGHGVC